MSKSTLSTVAEFIGSVVFLVLLAALAVAMFAM